MPWYFYSFAALIAGACYALAKKWSLNLKITKERLLLFTFSGAFLSYFFYNLPHLNRIVHQDNFHLLMLWGILIAVLSVAGNFLDTYAMQVSPNPAYGEGLKSTNAILITIGSVILFGSEFSWIKLIGMVLITAGFFPLFFSKVKTKEGNWKTPSLIALFIFTAMILTVRHLGNIGFSASEILLVLFFYGGIGYGILNLFYGKQIEKPKKLIWLAVLLAIGLSFVANLANFTAIKIAPNAGYSQGIVNASVILVLVFSKIIFGKHEGGDFNLMRWLGAIVIIAGVVLLAI